jgi:hypothetical protein
MDPIITPLITGGASLIGSMFSSDTSAANTQAQIQAQQGMQAQTEQFNAGQAQLNRDYQTQMSNTAYQRASSDMQKAGLNPMMMFGSGGAASSPSGSTASVGTPTVPVSQSKGALSGLGDAVKMGVDTAVTAKTFDKMSEEIASLKATQIKTAAETATESEKPALVNAETAKTEADTAQTWQGTTAMKLDRARQEWDAMKYLDLSNMPDSIRRGLNLGAWGGGKASEIVAPVVNSAVKLGGMELLKNAMKNKYPGVLSNP